MRRRPQRRGTVAIPPSFENFANSQRLWFFLIPLSCCHSGSRGSHCVPDTPAIQVGMFCSHSSARPMLPQWHNGGCRFDELLRFKITDSEYSSNTLPANSRCSLHAFGGVSSMELKKQRNFLLLPSFIESYRVASHRRLRVTSYIIIFYSMRAVGLGSTDGAIINRWLVLLPNSPSCSCEDFLSNILRVSISNRSNLRWETF